jgi:hypothetical protein
MSPFHSFRFASRGRENRAIVLDYGPVNLVALVGKPKGMHAETEKFQFSTFVGFGSESDAFDGIRACSFGKLGHR